MLSIPLQKQIMSKMMATCARLVNGCGGRLACARFSSAAASTPDEHSVQQQILHASLPYVHTYGWSAAAISQGAESLGYSAMADGMFARGGTDLVNFFYQHCNQELQQQLEQPTKHMDTTEVLRSAAQTRLRMNAPYADTWSQALALHYSPANVCVALHNVATLADHMCYHAGDTSHDITWYHKRLAVAAVYKSTEMCMLQDSTPDYQDTWKFLDRRLAGMNCAADCLHSANDVSTVAKAGVMTALNIFGLNSKTR